MHLSRLAHDFSYSRVILGLVDKTLSLPLLWKRKIAHAQECTFANDVIASRHGSSSRHLRTKASPKSRLEETPPTGNTTSRETRRTVLGSQLSFHNLSCRTCCIIFFFFFFHSQSHTRLPCSYRMYPNESEEPRGHTGKTGRRLARRDEDTPRTEGGGPRT